MIFFRMKLFGVFLCILSPVLHCCVCSFDRIYLVSISSSFMNKLYIMCALISLVILTIRVTYLFSTCPLKLLDCQASIASEENVIVILLFGVFLCILSLACLYSNAWWSCLTTELKLNRNKLQYLGVWAPAQNNAAEAPLAGRRSVGQRRGGVGAGAVFSR